jgi:ABC-type antimicrobial peptide transport system permease subunit
LVTGLLAGSYPSLYLSKFAPAQVLRGKLNRTAAEAWARKGLVVFQFALSVVFMVCVWVIYKQVEFVQNRNLGYNKDNLLYFEATGRVATDAEAFVQQVQQLPGVVSASSLVGNLLQSGGVGNGTLTWQNKTVEVHGAAVNYGLLETMGLQIAEGRTFSRDFGADTLQFILNETAVKALGITDPVGKKLSGDYTIVGVVKDFHFQSLHENVKPFCFRLEPHYATHIMVRLAAGGEAQTIAALEALHKRANPGFGLDYAFQDQAYQAQYVAEKRVGILSRYFAGVAIIVSCLGLFGLATFTTERRRKEIGIRKVLGSGELRILYLLTRDFSLMVILAIVIALPVSRYVAHRWLQGFAYRIDLAWWYFAGAAALALALAWFTVSVQTLRAARVNPAECLKDE